MNLDLTTSDLADVHIDHRVTGTQSNYHLYPEIHYQWYFALLIKGIIRVHKICIEVRSYNSIEYFTIIRFTLRTTSFEYDNTLIYRFLGLKTDNCIFIRRNAVGNLSIENSS